MFTEMNLDVIIVDSTAGAITITLDEVPVDGKFYYIKDIGNASANNVTIDGNGKYIDGAATLSLTTNYADCEVMFCSTNSKWFIL